MQGFGICRKPSVAEIGLWLTLTAPSHHAFSGSADVKIRVFLEMGLCIEFYIGAFDFSEGPTEHVHVGTDRPDARRGM